MVDASTITATPNGSTRTDAAARPRRFFAVGHNIPLEVAMLGLWQSYEARAWQVAILSRRIGHLNDEQLVLRAYAIVIYGEASAVIAEALDAAERAERRAQIARAA